MEKIKKSLFEKRITKKQFFLSLTIFIFSLSALFGYFYWKKMSVLNLVNKIPIVQYTKPPKYVQDLYGPQNMPLKMPLGVLAREGFVYAADSDMGVVHMLDYNGKFIRTFGNNEGRGKLKNPYGMAISNGTLYIADSGQGKILMFTKDGKFIGSILPKEKGIMTSPAGIFVKKDKIYFTDLGLRTVNVMDLEGNVSMVFGSKGEDEGQFDYPHGLAVDEKGQIYVADSGNNRVQVFTEKGIFKKVLGDEKGQVGTPRGIDIDNKGNIYVVSGIENRVHVFNKKGEWKFAFNEVLNKDSLSLPNGISLDGNGNLFISETGSSKIALFSYNNIKL